MKWCLEWGPHLERLEKSAEAGANVPRLDKAPELFEHLRDYWQAYVHLDRSRYHGGTGYPQPITAAEIIAYGQIQGFCQSDLIDLSHYIRELDNVYLEHVHEKREKERKRKK